MKTWTMVRIFTAAYKHVTVPGSVVGALSPADTLMVCADDDDEEEEEEEAPRKSKRANVRLLLRLSVKPACWCTRVNGWLINKWICVAGRAEEACTGHPSRVQQESQDRGANAQCR